MVQVLRERQGDAAAVRRINEEAFGDDAEAKIVDELRCSCGEYLSFVAIEDGAVVGHILFTPITLDDNPMVGMGLAPMAVRPTHQRRGIGSLLIGHGLDHLRRSGCPFVIVLGHPEYYPRFGFELASHYQVHSQWQGVPDEAFMILVLDPIAVSGLRGVARYRSEFDAAM